MIRNQDSERFSWLVEHGVDLNVPRRDTSDAYLLAHPLWFYAITHNLGVDVMRKMIEYGVDVNKKDTVVGDTALHLAAESDDSGYCRVLLESGASVHAQNFNCRQPIHLASGVAKRENLVSLIAAGADATARATFGLTPLHMYAAGHSESDDGATVTILLRAGADIDAVDDRGRNAAFRAIALNSPSRLFNLIRHGISLGSYCRAAENDLFGFLTFEPHRDGPVRHGQVIACLYMAGTDIDPEYWRERQERFWKQKSDPRVISEYTQSFDKHCALIIRCHTAEVWAVCTGLQALKLPALVLCEIIQALLWFWPRLKFHDIWNRVVAVRHFHERRQRARLVFSSKA